MKWALSFLNFIYSYLEKERKRERERERGIAMLFHLLMHSLHYWLILICDPTGNQTQNLGVLGGHSNQLSYPARAEFFLFHKSIVAALSKLGHLPFLQLSLHLHMAR